MSTTQPILVARNSRTDLFLLPQMANRHGLVAGATGTGKTVTLQGLAESFSAQGVPVFLADVKGDLAGLSQPGGQSPKVLERVAQLKNEGYTPAGCPVTFWDVFGQSGHPVRATISEMGPRQRRAKPGAAGAGTETRILRLDLWGRRGHARPCPSTSLADRAQAPGGPSAR